ncbi:MULTISPECIES: 5'-nucleotidase C-terminal domain-containing protein [Limosilactobacillus]|uniref:5'-nucleotidase C-terminal domain-containing protein n=1 Tax=Limosilactobacillus sp. TaxID=2773925 RepID=UPI0029DD831E|nr:5'-nucleotidase C-terminal domain-containing protein [Limosilactobacillus sp.]
MITGRLHNTPTRENQAGELAVDGQLAEARKLGVNADFAMTNTGGLRADLIVEPDRTITWGAAQAVQPFGNILRVVEMTGQQVIDALNQQYDEDQKYYLQIAGLKYYYTDSDDPNQPYRVVAAYDENGQPLDMNKTYRVVINDFLAGGGDGFTAFKGTNQIAVIGADTEVFMSYIADQTNAGNLIKAPVTDRKNYLTPAEAEALLHPVVPDTPANSETGQTNTEDTSSTNGSAADAKQNQEITVDNSATPQLKIVNGQDQTAPVAIAVKSTERKASQTALPQTGNDEKSALALLGTALIGLSGMFVIRRRPRRQK